MGYRTHSVKCPSDGYPMSIRWPSDVIWCDLVNSQNKPTCHQISTNIKNPVNFRVFILPYESTEELSKTVYSYAPAEKSMIQPLINSINVSLYVTLHSLPSPASTNFTQWCGETLTRFISCQRILLCGSSKPQTCDHQIMSSTRYPFGHRVLDKLCLKC